MPQDMSRALVMTAERDARMTVLLISRMIASMRRESTAISSGSKRSSVCAMPLPSAAAVGEDVEVAVRVGACPLAGKQQDRRRVAVDQGRARDLRARRRCVAVVGGKRTEGSFLAEINAAPSPLG